ncbi:MAG TPA: KH domain-containing protein [Acidimicrobiales bacterium]|nr:KH domain-containing protein [Acidimicrobiales bacterium]HJM27632.1 KH domain-containing protein [Acidimicrobiales bacterium]HJM98605.1 KH domain-containing protein [Acidimicrobiales bacterium]
MSEENNVVSHAYNVLEHIVKSVVEKPDEVQINIQGNEEETTLAVKVGDGDMGRVIGRRGRIANAIRTVTRAAAVRDGVAVSVEFVD